MSKLSRKKIFGLCFLTALLLTMSFPRLEWWLLAWGALIPFMKALDGHTPKEGFRIGYLCGVLSFTGTLYWIFHVTEWFSVIAAIGVIFLFLYLAFYFAIFGMIYCKTQSLSKPLRLILLPSIWVVLEWLRAHLFSGFGWISLGYSQFRNLPSIQIADISGVYGVSFVLLMTNYFLKDINRVRRSKQDLRLFRIIFYVVFIGHILYGAIRLSEAVPTKTFKVGVVQGNIEQEMKWAEFAWPMIMKAHKRLTQMAMAHTPDMIIWPESSFPGIMGEDDSLFAEIQTMTRNMKTPLLIGAIEKRKEQYYNTAILLDQQGQRKQHHDKIHLVPFGEFLPGRSMLGKAAEMVPIADFTSGTEFTVFRQVKDKPFSLVICFEDTVAYLARRFVRNGTQVLINITNDAWFKDSKAATLHLSSSLFRTVENRRSMIRAANTGVSNAIDPYGRIIAQVVEHDGKRLNVPSYMIAEVPLNKTVTFYSKFGDVFVLMCLACFGVILRPKKNN